VQGRCRVLERALLGTLLGFFTACDGEIVAPVPVDAIFASDGSLVVLGATTSSTATPDPVTGELPLDELWLGRLDGLEGARARWQVSFGTEALEGATGLAQTRAGTILVAGYTFDPMADADAWLLGLSDDGGIAFSRLVRGPSFEELRDVVELSDGDLGAIGNHDSMDGSGALVARFDALGGARWRRVLSSTAVRLSGQRIVEREGAMIVAGVVSTGVEAPPTGSFVVALDGAGDVEWHRSLSGEGGILITRLRVLEGGDLVLVGHTAVDPALEPTDPAARRDVRVAVLDGLSGEPTWDRAYEVEEGDEVPHDVLELDDGRLAVVGTSDAFGTRLEGDTDVWVLLLTADGALEAQRAYGGADPDRPLAAREGDDGELDIAAVTGTALAGFSIGADGEVVAGCGDMRDTTAIELAFDLVAAEIEGLIVLEPVQSTEDFSPTTSAADPLEAPVCTP
jgi:hypothetical protein